MELSSFSPNKSSQDAEGARNRGAGNAGRAQGRQQPGDAEGGAASY